MFRLGAESGYQMSANFKVTNSRTRPRVCEEPVVHLVAPMCVLVSLVVNYSGCKFSIGGCNGTWPQIK